MQREQLCATRFRQLQRLLHCFCASLEPSVGTRMFLNMIVFPSEVSAARSLKAVVPRPFWPSSGRHSLI